MDWELVLEGLSYGICFAAMLFGGLAGSLLGLAVGLWAVGAVFKRLDE